MSLAELKKKRNSVEQLQEKLQKLESKSGGGQADERFWKPTRDKDGNGTCLIRFMPAPQGEDDSFVRVYTNAVNNYKTKKFLNELSLATIGQADPITEYWWGFYESKHPKAEWIRRDEKFISNILVIKDPANPDNDGKVFLYEYGKQIFNKIKGKMSPDEGFESEAFDPFDPWEGANFKIKIISKDVHINGKDIKMPNYESSEFASQSKIGDDDKIEEIYNQEHSLKQFIDPKRFKSYDELKKAVERVLDISPSDLVSKEQKEADEMESQVKAREEISKESIEFDTTKTETKKKAATKVESDSTSADEFFSQLGLD